MKSLKKKLKSFSTYNILEKDENSPSLLNHGQQKKVERKIWLDLIFIDIFFSFRVSLSIWENEKSFIPTFPTTKNVYHFCLQKNLKLSNLEKIK